MKTMPGDSGNDEFARTILTLTMWEEVLDLCKTSSTTDYDRDYTFKRTFFSKLLIINRAAYYYREFKNSPNSNVTETGYHLPPSIGDRYTGYRSKTVIKII